MKKMLRRRKDGVVQHYNVNDMPVKVKKAVIKQNYTDVSKELKKEGRVRLPGLGILRVKTKPARKAHMGRNPATGEEMKIKAKPKRKVVRFRAAKELQEMVL